MLLGSQTHNLIFFIGKDFAIVGAKYLLRSPKVFRVLSNQSANLRDLGLISSDKKAAKE